MTRRSVWSKSEVHKALEDFVAATDETTRLSRGKDPASRAFQRFAEKGHYGGRVKPSRTRQGMYAVTPGGRFLASCNTRSSARLLAMLRQARARWDAMSEAERLAGSEGFGAQPTEHWARRYPKGGLVLRVSTRDLPGRKQPKDWRANAWNLDYAWFTRQEARSWLPVDLTAGAQHSVPAKLVRRLVRLHLVDNVRGQVSSFKSRDVRTATLTTKVLAVEATSVAVQITGKTLAVRQGKWHVAGFRQGATEQEQGFATDLVGRATFDTKANRFTEFSLVGVGRSWGGSRFNARADDLAGGPIGVLLELASDQPSERVAPARIWNYGW